MLGGYKLIDFGGVDISTSKTISGIYNEIEKTEKRIVGCNLKLGTTTFKELTLDVKKDGTNLVLSNSIIKVTITNANAVVGELGLYNGYSDDNASTKKIYYHPIYTNSPNGRLQFLILDNNPNAYDIVTLLTKLKELMGVGALINVNGCIKEENDEKYTTSYLMVLVGDIYTILGFDENSYGHTYNLDTYWESIISVTDGVNAIN